MIPIEIFMDLVDDRVPFEVHLEDDQRACGAYRISAARDGRVRLSLHRD